MFDIVRENSGIVFYLFYCLYFGRFCIFVGQWAFWIMQVLGIYLRLNLLLFFVLFTGHIYALPRYYFKQISLQNGLSQSSVQCVLVDNRGVMWIGTRFGLNRFDRENITVYKEEKNNPYSLPYNEIVFLEEDAEDNIWVGTSGGLARFDRNTRQFVRQEIDNEPLVVTCCFLMPEGICFFGKQGSFCYSYAEKKIVRCPLKEKMSVSFPNYAFLYDEEERKVLVSFYGNGLWWYYPDTGEMTRVSFIHEKHIPSLYLDSSGRIWVAVYNKGVFCYEHDGRLVEHLTAPETLTHNVVQDMREKDGELWLATDGGGINIYNYKEKSVKAITHLPGDNHSLPVNSFACLYSDDEDNIWAGSIRGGLIGIKQVFMTTYRDSPPGASYGLSFQSVTSMYEDTDGKIWMGTDGEGLNLFDPQKETFRKFPQTSGMKIVSIIPYNNSDLLLSLFGVGLYRLNRITGECREFRLNWGNIQNDLFQLGNSVCLYRADEERFCLLSDNRFFVYNQRKQEFEFFPEEMIPDDFPAPRFIQGDSCYISSSKGMYVLDLPERQLRPVFLSGEKTGTITSVRQSEDKRFWLGTSSGLYIYDHTQHKLDTVDTERFSGIMSLSFDSRDRLWLSTHEGLYVYVPHENRIIVFGESDGVFTQEFLPQSALVASSGDIYMPGVEGVVRIRPDQGFQKEKDCSVSLINLTLNGFPLHPDGFSGEPVIAVPWDYTSLGLNVIVKENDLMRKKLFRFSIRGDREDLLETSSHSFVFPALPPGNYELWVSYSKKNGDWSIPLKLLTVDVIPPLWRRTWFIVAVTFMTLLVGGWIVWSVLKRKERKLDLAIKEQERKFYEEKVRFMVNISHELRTPLTLIYAPLKRLLKSGQVADKGLFRLLDGLLLQARRMQEIVDLVLDAQKSDTNGDVMDIRFYNLNDWLRLVAEDFTLELQARGIYLDFKLDPLVKTVPFDASKCRVILSNLLMNAIKFSDSDSQLVISTEHMKTSVRISLSDQGIGLDNVDMNRLFSCYYQGEHDRKGSGIGLAYVRKLVELHGGSISAYNNEEHGATFCFDLPLVQASVSTDMRAKGRGGQDVSLRTEDEFPLASVDFPLNKYTLLVAEDEPELRNYLSCVLQAEFKRVYVAEDGEKAWNLLGQYQPDIVVSDVMMPRMDGVELCSRIKNDLAFSHIPVVLLTARADGSSTLQGYKSGADMYLAKPFDVDSLLVIFRNILKHRDLLRTRYQESGRLFSPKEDAVSNADEQFMQKLNGLICENLGNPNLSVTFIASAMAMSRTTLYSKFSHLSDISIGDYIVKYRMVEAARLLTTRKDISIQEIADRTGFSSARYFSTAFKQVYGVTPTEYRKN